MAHQSLEMESPYREAFEGVLRFSTFAEAEQTIRQLQALSENYRDSGDRKGVEYCRQIALLGRRRAELIGRNGRVAFRKRQQKREIANWFAVWLENPSLFDDWLAMRKGTEEFLQLRQEESGKGKGVSGKG